MEKGFQGLALSKKKGAAGAKEQAEGRAEQEAIRRFLAGLPDKLVASRAEFESILHCPPVSPCLTERHPTTLLNADSPPPRFILLVMRRGECLANRQMASQSTMEPLLPGSRIRAI